LSALLPLLLLPSLLPPLLSLSLFAAVVGPAVVVIPIVAVSVLVTVADVAVAGPIAAAVIVVTALGDVACMQHHCSCCWQGSTHNPPHEQWLVRLEVGAWLLVAVSLLMGGGVISGTAALE
jgi:hypothetical protein